MRYHIKREFLIDSQQQCVVPPGTYFIYKDIMKNDKVILTDGEKRYTIYDYEFRQGKERGWIKEALLKECA